MSLLKREDIDLMAPVGSYESLMAAIQAGANSVYFGLDKLNMRARSTVNFKIKDLEKIVDICNDHFINAYLTLNIVIYEQEIEKMKKIVDTAQNYGVKAIIASDHAVINYARSVGMEVHISTQVNISNFESLKFYANFADVVVLARELNLDQAKEINNK